MSGRTSTPWAVNGERLKVAVEWLFVAVRASRLLLFGSHVRCDADSHSDVELMVVATVVPNRFEEMGRLRKSLDGMLLPVELLVVSEETFVERSQGPAPVEHDDAVRDHLVSDVPIGEFLSAGIDSTVLVALAARHVGGLRMFTVGFDEPGAADELAGAKIAAESIGSKHEAIVLTRDRMAHLWQQWLAALDHPSIDGFNSFVIRRAVGDAGLTAAGSGQGGDELFGGYGSFSVAEWYSRFAQGIQRLPRFLRSAAVRLASVRLPNYVHAKAIDLFCGATSPAEVAIQMRLVLSNKQITSLGPPAASVGLPKFYADREAFEGARGDSSDADAFAMVSRLERRLCMGNMLLSDTAANSMASSFEIRVPFLGQQVVDYVSRLTRAVRSPPGFAPKRLRKKVFGDLFPPALLSRPKKGFTLPIDRSMRGPMRDSYAAAVEAAAGCGILELAETRRLWDRVLPPGSSLLWTPVMPLVSLVNRIKAARNAPSASRVEMHLPPRL